LAFVGLDTKAIKEASLLLTKLINNAENLNETSAIRENYTPETEHV
jgi:hypothetical protein